MPDNAAVDQKRIPVTTRDIRLLKRHGWCSIPKVEGQEGGPVREGMAYCSETNREMRVRLNEEELRKNPTSLFLKYDKVDEPEGQKS